MFQPIPNEARQLLARELPEHPNENFDYDDALTYLEGLAEALDLDERDLGPLVREAALEHAADASEGGTSAQVDYLLEMIGPEKVRDRMLRAWSDSAKRYD